MIELATLPPTVQTQILDVIKYQKPIPIADKGKVIAILTPTPSNSTNLD